MTPVIDASVAVKWFIWEDGTDKAHQLLDELTSFYAPDLFLMEIDSTITKKVRQNELEISDALKKRRAFRQLPAKLIPYKNLEEFAFRLASEFSVTLYDATYIATAVDHDVILYTADHRLANGMQKTPFGKYIQKLNY